VAFAGVARAQKPPLLPEKDVAALANELSGETAKRNLEGIARFHRQRGSRGFHEAAELVAERLRAYGLSEVAILQFPADGATMYGTQRSRPAWDAQVGNLGELWFDPKWCEEPARSTSQLQKTRNESRLVPECSPRERTLGSYEAEPVVLAEDSESGEATANLVMWVTDEGERLCGKNVKGNNRAGKRPAGRRCRIWPWNIRRGGNCELRTEPEDRMVGEDENLIRWGHLETFSPNKTFAFMVSLKTARGFRERWQRRKNHAARGGEGGQHPGNYEVVTATIPGADPKLKEEEIAF